MESTAIATRVHAWEAAGYGKAPFTVVGYHKEPRGTACDVCGTGIIHVFSIASADNRQFVVGSDCVAKTGDAGLIGAVRLEEKRRREAAKEARRQAYLASPEYAAEMDAKWATRAVYALVDGLLIWKKNHQRWLGAIGAKVTFAATLEKRFSLHNEWGACDLNVLRDDDGNRVVWFGMFGANRPGDRFVIEAEVKAHEWYQGEKQTTVRYVRVRPR